MSYKSVDKFHVKGVKIAIFCLIIAYIRSAVDNSLLVDFESVQNHVQIWEIDVLYDLIRGERT